MFVVEYDIISRRKRLIKKLYGGLHMSEENNQGKNPYTGTTKLSDYLNA